MKYLLPILLLTACGKGVSFGMLEAAHLEPADDNFFYVAGALQHDPVTHEWELLNDPLHGSVGVARIEVKSDCIVVWYSRVASKVTTLQISMDDTFAQNGYFAGPSVGVDRFVLFFSKIDNGVVVPINPDQTYINAGESVLFYGVMQK